MADKINVANGIPPEVVDEIFMQSFGVTAEEFAAMTIEEQLALSLARGVGYACTPSIAPKDVNGVPITEGKAVPRTKH